MGISEVKSAFNSAAAGVATAERAFLTYETKHDVNWQVLRFQGTYSDGTAMNITRDCRPETDLASEAALAAADAIKQRPKGESP